MPLHGVVLVGSCRRLRRFSAEQDEDGTQLGVAAQQAAASDPLNSFYSVKRLVGRSYANCYREAATLVYKLEEGEDGETLLWSPARSGSLPVQFPA